MKKIRVRVCADPSSPRKWDLFSYSWEVELNGCWIQGEWYNRKSSAKRGFTRWLIKTYKILDNIVYRGEPYCVKQDDIEWLDD
jgi:hypothetical protein